MPTGADLGRRAEFDAYWGPFWGAYEAIVFGGADPDEAVAVCAEMDAINGL